MNQARMNLPGLAKGQTMTKLRWVLAACSVCLPAALPAAEPVDPVSARIDEITRRHVTASGAGLAERTTDAEFLRRVWLDLAGRTPPVEATQKALDKLLDRARLVDELLVSTGHAQHWGRLWTEYFTDRRPFDQPDYDPRRLQQYFTEAVRNNTPYDALLGELVTGEGVSDCTGPVNFLLRYNADPVALAGAVSQKFLGVSLQCAECHDHPHAAWKQADFWGLAAHFARLRKMTATNPQEGENFLVVVERPRGELMMEDKRAPKDENGQVRKKIVFPQLPGRPRTSSTAPRRMVLVDWLASGENPYVSRQAVNLVWQRLMGAKLIDHFDAWPSEQPTSESELVNLLADDFVQHEFDMQRLIRVIVLSETYQRSAQRTRETESAASTKEHDLPGWSRARLRALSADQLHLSIAQAFGYHFDENDFRIAEATGSEFTYDLPTQSFSATPLSLTRAVSLYSSEHIRGAVDLGAEALVRLYGATVGPEHIERLFLALLSRKPTPLELEQFQELAGVTDVRQGLQDAAWVILNSTEFVTNH